jgi:hypothetical protein
LHSLDRSRRTVTALGLIVLAIRIIDIVADHRRHRRLGHGVDAGRRIARPDGGVPLVFIRSSRDREQ